MSNKPVRQRDSLVNNNKFKSTKTSLTKEKPNIPKQKKGNSPKQKISPQKSREKSRQNSRKSKERTYTDFLPSIED